MSRQSKTDILKSFSKFISCAISPQKRNDDSRHDASIPLWFMESSFASEDAFKAYTNILIADQSSHHIQALRYWQDNEDQNDPYGSFVDYPPLFQAIENGDLSIANIQQAASDTQQFLDFESGWTNERRSGVTLLTVRNNAHFQACPLTNFLSYRNCAEPCNPFSSR